MTQELKFDENGLIPVVVQDALSNEVLMVAYANQESYHKMIETGQTWFYSRSRKQLWNKGESSGNYQDIVSIQADCDGDTLLVRVRQHGVACHTGDPSCFGDVVYGDLAPTAAIIPELARVIRDRKEHPVADSYTSTLLQNEDKRLKKLVEEAAEVILAAKDKDVRAEAWEVADLVYHLMVAIEGMDLPMEEVYKKLAERRK
jgi:phosphoribosyl-ATP pyrophosphohydrolase/phosphoribosyl-AMP cyclohydrolase